MDQVIFYDRVKPTCYTDAWDHRGIGRLRGRILLLSKLFSNQMILYASIYGFICSQTETVRKIQEVLVGMRKR